MPSPKDSPPTTDTPKDTLAALLYGQGSIAICLERLSFAFSAASDLIKDWGGANDFDGSSQDDFHLYSTLLDHYSTSFLLASTPIKQIPDPISSLSEDSKHLTDLKSLHRSASQKADLAKHKLSKKRKKKQEEAAEKAIQEVVALEEKVRAEEAMLKAMRLRKMKVWMEAVFSGLRECARMGVIISEGGKRILDLGPDDKPSAISILTATQTRLQASPTPSTQTSSTPSSRRVFPPDYGGLPMIHESESLHSGGTTSLRTTKYTTLDTSMERSTNSSQSTISRPLSQVPTTSPSYLQPTSQTPIPLFAPRPIQIPNRAPSPSPSPSSPSHSYTQPVQEKTSGRSDDLYRSFPHPYESFEDGKLAG
ncbi:hypothetical protein JAAARDRAFT_209645 [Jaapia argillacea MUCL 33604]|uniref:Uncharacterized protein n=1 Tax=Jaapia argillacea MUCL 33604 TaxID=933084 RepID=A0A067PRC6_9AGAM|nr:hypothetical protein JAAARDRAFT_209645 [Jaapia argillacea MUCL 33604]